MLYFICSKEFLLILIKCIYYAYDIIWNGLLSTLTSRYEAQLIPMVEDGLQFRYFIALQYVHMCGKANITETNYIDNQRDGCQLEL